MGEHVAGPALPAWLRDILRCPACLGTLADGPGELRCTSMGCGLRYRVEDGIPVLLVDEAQGPE
jgi:uncharacterized protein YbaR (Trm112 family)